MKSSLFTFIPSAVLVACSLANAAKADIVAGNVTDFFGNKNTVSDAGDASGLLFDEARTGGSDSSNFTSVNLTRKLDAVSGTNNNWAAGLSTGTAGTLTFSGLGFAFPGSGVTASQLDLTIRYLGADATFNTSDDEVVGFRSNPLSYSGANEYVWEFDTPLTFGWDGAAKSFRFELSTSGTGNLRFKTRPANESPSGQTGVVLSVGGNFVAVPEPTSFAFLAIVTTGVGVEVLRRRFLSQV